MIDTLFFNFTTAIGVEYFMLSYAFLILIMILSIVIRNFKTKADYNK